MHRAEGALLTVRGAVHRLTFNRVADRMERVAAPPLGSGDARGDRGCGRPRFTTDQSLALGHPAARRRPDPRNQCCLQSSRAANSSGGGTPAREKPLGSWASRGAVAVAHDVSVLPPVSERQRSDSYSVRADAAASVKGALSDGPVALGRRLQGCFREADKWLRRAPDRMNS
jgi:hypothetical protein